MKFQFGSLKFNLNLSFFPNLTTASICIKQLGRTIRTPSYSSMTCKIGMKNLNPSFPNPLPTTMCHHVSIPRLDWSHLSNSWYQRCVRPDRGLRPAASTVSSTDGSRWKSARSSRRCLQRRHNTPHPQNWTSDSVCLRMAEIVALATSPGRWISFVSAARHLSRRSRACAAFAALSGSSPHQGSTDKTFTVASSGRNNSHATVQIGGCWYGDQSQAAAMPMWCTTHTAAWRTTVDTQHWHDDHLGAVLQTWVIYNVRNPNVWPNGQCFLSV